MSDADSENDPVDDVVEAIDSVASQPEATEAGFDEDGLEGEEQTEQSAANTGIDSEVVEELKSRENQRIKRTAAMGYILQNMLNALASRTTNDPLDHGTLIATVELFERVFGIWAMGDLVPLTWLGDQKPSTKEELAAISTRNSRAFEYLHKRVSQLYKDYQFTFRFLLNVERLDLGPLLHEEMQMMRTICRAYGLRDDQWALCQEHLRRTLIDVYPTLMEVISLAMRDVNTGRPGARGGGYTLHMGP